LYKRPLGEEIKDKNFKYSENAKYLETFEKNKK